MLWLPHCMPMGSTCNTYVTFHLQGQLIQPHSPTLCTCKGGSEVLHVIVMEGENEAVIVW